MESKSTNNNEPPKRISVKLIQPNPLFELWLTQWKKKAKEKGSKLEHSYALALDSLKKYPLPLKTGKDCKVLYGFGDKLCLMLDRKLIDFNNANRENNGKNNDSNNVSQPPGSIPSENSIDNSNNLVSHDNGQNVMSLNDYEKAGNSDHEGSDISKTDKLKVNEPGVFAILDILHKCSEHSLLKNEIIKQISPGMKSTAWTKCIGILLNDQLVTRSGKPFKYSLTSKGSLLAKELTSKSPQKSDSSETLAIIQQNSTDAERNDGDDISHVKETQNPCSSKATESNSSEITESLIFAPSTFDIILYVDTQETGAAIDVSKDPFLIKLKSFGILFEIKHLNVGDYTWICRDRKTNNELVLPYIVERKRLDDFASSIKDGRYHEQKYRLKRSGMQNIFYLIENYGKKQRCGLPIKTLQQAAINTIVQDGFIVKNTADYCHTAKFLTNLTKHLIHFYKDKTLFSTSRENLKKISINDDLIPLMNFRDFNEGSSKTKPPTVTELFVKMLLQLKGMSVDKALAIVKVYPTPLLLKKAFDESDVDKGAKLLAHIEFGKFKKKIGPQLSKTLYQLFTFDSFNIE